MGRCRFLLLLLVLLAGCSPKTAGEAVDPLRANSLIIAYPADVESLMSVVPQSGADTEVLAAIDMMLLMPTFECGLSYEPLIAESWSFSEDGRTLDMVLSDAFRWSDGQPVTAHDVAFTYELIADPDVGSPRRGFIEHMVEGARPRVLDDHHLQFEFTHAYDPATMIAHATGVELLPKHVLADADRANLRGHAYHDAPVTCGPFKLDERIKGQTITLVSDEQWGGPATMKPALQRVIFKVLPEYSTRLLELKNGSVDVMAGLEVADADALAASHPDIALKRRGYRAMEYVGWNAIDPQRYQEITAGEGDPPDPAEAGPHPLFGDPAVRRALTQAIDADRMMQDHFGSPAAGEVYAKRAVGTITPSLCGMHNDEIAPLPHDPQAARDHLAALGWVDSDADGVLDKDGRPFRFGLLVSSGKPRYEAVAVTVQAALKQIGVDVQIESLEFNAYVQRAIAKDFDAMVGGWSMDFFVDPTSKWHSGPGYTYNFVSYANPEADALIERGLSQTDPAEAAATWRELQRVIHDDQPYTFLWWRDEIVAVNGRITGARTDLLSATAHLWEWTPAGVAD